MKVVCTTVHVYFLADTHFCTTHANITKAQ